MTPPQRRNFSFVLAALCAGLLVTACSSTKLESGGAYAPATTNAAGVVTTTPDYAFFVVDAAFDLAHSALDAAFTFEYQNRAFLWQISPKIKHTLDKLRPQALMAEMTYAASRNAYLRQPITANFTALQTALDQVKTLSAAAAAALPQSAP